MTSRIDGNGEAAQAPWCERCHKRRVRVARTGRLYCHVCARNDRCQACYAVKPPGAPAGLCADCRAVLDRGDEARRGDYPPPGVRTQGRAAARGHQLSRAVSGLEGGA